MAKKFQLTIVTPTGKFFDGEIDELNVKTKSGYMSVLRDHIPLVGTIDISKLLIKDGSNRTVAAIAGGLLYVEKDKTTIITDAIEKQEEIDFQRANKALIEAEKTLQEKSGKANKHDTAQIEMAMARAKNRLALKK